MKKEKKLIYQLLKEKGITLLDGEMLIKIDFMHVIMEQ